MPRSSSSSSLALIGLTYFLLSTVAASVRSRDHRVDAGAVRDGVRPRRRRRAGGGDPARRRPAPATSRCSSAPSARSRTIWSTSARRPTWQPLRSRRSSTTPAPAASRRGACSADRTQGEPLEVASVRLHRRHAVPGRQEHGAARGSCSRASALSCSSTSRRSIAHRPGRRRGLHGIGAAPAHAASTTPSARSCGPANVHARVPAREHRRRARRARRSVNAMLDRIEALVAGMRGALDNVAHDLRTPMTRLRGIAETRAAVAAATRRRSARRWPTASRNPTASSRCSTR